MELTNEQYNAIYDKLMDVPGVSKEHESSLLMEEGPSGKTYLKFMSDHGVTDKSNGAALHAFLVKNNTPHEYFQDRKFVISNEALHELFLK